MRIARPVEVIFLYGPETATIWFDFPELANWASGLPGARVLALNPALPASEQEQRLRAFLYQAGNPLVIVGLDPGARGRTTLSVLLEEFHLDPDLLSLVDLHEALQYPHPRYATIKAQELITLAASRVSRAHAMVVQDLSVSTQVLVWGDSFPACQAALELAGQDYPVILAAPGAALTPLAPGSPSPHLPPEKLAPLLSQVQSHPLIRLVTNAAILDFQGGVGNFTVRLQSAAGLLKEKVGAVILAPELKISPQWERYGLSPQPWVITQSRLEELLASPGEPPSWLEPASHLREVAFLVGLAGDTYPPAMRRTLRAVSRLLSQGNLKVHLFLNHAKVADLGLEEALEADLAAGLRLYKLPQAPQITQDNGRPRLSFLDPVLHLPMALNSDLVVLDESYQAPPENAALAELFRLNPDSAGFLQKENVHHLAGLTNRQGVFVVGAGHAILDLDQSLAEAEAAVLAVQKLLDQGRVSSPRGRAVVDRGRCALCLTCYRLCPHGAITFDNRAVIRELDCQGCGLCASECPNEAVQLRNYADDQIRAELQNLDPRLKPRIIAFMCQNSAWDAYHTAIKMEHAVLPRGFTGFKMPCAGKIDLDYILEAFTNGAAGVMVLSCHPENCKSLWGNEHAHWRVEEAQDRLAEAGLDPRRVSFTSLAANSPQDFLDAVHRFRATLEALK